MRQCRCNVLLIKNQFREKTPVLPIEKFPFLALARNTIMLQHLILIHFSLHYLPGSRLREVENKGKCQTVSSKSGRGHLREVVSYKSFQVKSLYLEPLEEVPNKVI